MSIFHESQDWFVLHLTTKFERKFYKIEDCLPFTLYFIGPKLVAPTEI